MKSRQMNCLAPSSRVKASRYVLFAPERGVLSEHRNLDDAVIAYYLALRTRRPTEKPPAIYEQLEFDWKQVTPAFHRSIGQGGWADGPAGP